jgi:hypothetical protein
MVICREKNGFGSKCFCFLKQVSNKGIFANNGVRATPEFRISRMCTYTANIIQGIYLDSMSSKRLDDAQSIIMAIKDQSRISLNVVHNSLVTGI